MYTYNTYAYTYGICIIIYDIHISCMISEYWMQGCRPMLLDEVRVAHFRFSPSQLNHRYEKSESQSQSREGFAKAIGTFGRRELEGSKEAIQALREGERCPRRRKCFRKPPLFKGRTSIRIERIIRVLRLSDVISGISNDEDPIPLTDIRCAGIFY